MVVVVVVVTRLETAVAANLVVRVVKVAGSTGLASVPEIVEWLVGDLIASSRAKCGVLSSLFAFSMLALVKACMCMGYIVIVLLWVIWEAKVKPDNMM